MATEYKLSYTATEIDEKLGKIDSLVATVNGVSPDANGNVEITVSGGNVDLTGYATEQYVQEYAQPKGNYLTEVPEGYAKTEEVPKNASDIGAQPEGDYALRSEIPSVPVKSVNGKTGAVSLTAADVKARPDNWMPTASDVGALPSSTVIPTVPTKVSEFTNDAGYLTEHQDISGKLDASALPTAINAALAQAKASGEFDGKDGVDGQPGKDGADGAKGDKGDKGDTGEPGQKGDKGDPGEKGEQGEKGDKGDTGAPGADGNGIKSAVLNADYTLTLTFDDGTSYTTPSIRGATGARGPQGPQGKQGETGAQGDPGYTPVRGVDYYTDADKSEFSEYIASELAKRGQLKPEYANSIKECTDTTKLYVLPDGFIYAYMTKTVTVNPTNQIRESINSDKTPYTGENGEDGYKVGYRFSNSTGAETALASYAVTGFIPCTVNDVIRTKNISFDTSATNSQIHFYDSSFAHILYIAGNSTTNSLASILNSNGNIEGSIAQSTNTLTDAQKSSIAYIRIAGLKFDDTAMVTLNEPLEASETILQGWHDTGLAFVPADYEERIIDLESRATSLENRVDELSVGNSGTITYIAEEAKRVAEIVQAKRTVGSLTFTAMSDPHIAVDVESTYGLENNLTSCRDAGLGLLALQKHFKLDFAAMLGDYTYVAKDGTITQVKKDISYFRNCMADGIKGIPSVWCTGNHDINYGANSDRRMTEDELYAYITGNNNGTTQDGDNIGRNYGYIDFENQKIRCVYLNTIDALDYPDNTDGTADDAMEITAVQARWLVDVGLDLSDKPNPTEWGVVLFSHHCLCQFPPVTAILTAYKDGASGSTSITTNGVTTVVDYDFTSANRGEIICAIHGHDHNFTYRKISSELWYQVTEANAWLWSICVPNVDTTRNNEKATNTDENYKNAFGEFDANGDPVYYPKTQGTATSTSFCVFTIDRKNRKIHAIHYGAGIDREIDY